MMTVHEVSSISGVSIRALHHYDRIGLLKAVKLTESGYRLYDEQSLARLQQILLFKELEFSLEEIRRILDDPLFDRELVLEQQIRLLELRREHLDDLIDFARGIKTIGVGNMSFEAFDTKKIEAYEAQAKAAWGNTDAYREFETKQSGLSKEGQQKRNILLMDIFREFGQVRDQAPSSPEAMALAKKLQQFITANFYHCSDEILLSLGSMYACGGDFTENIDKVGGAGTAAFANEAIISLVGQNH